MKWPRLQLKRHGKENHGGVRARSFNRNKSATLAQIRNQSGSVSFVPSHGATVGPMRNGLNVSPVTSGLILTAQMVHRIMFAITVTLIAISNNRTIVVLNI